MYILDPTTHAECKQRGGGGIPLGFSLVHVWFSKKEFEFQRLITLFSKYLL
jgi:hypothetical protein